MAVTTPLLAILIMAILLLGVTPTIHPVAYAQVANDRDNDGIEDESDPCPDDPDTACIEPPPAFACDPNVQSCPESPPEQVTGGTPPETPVGPSPQPPEIIFCIPNVEACNKTDVLINEAGDLICDPKEQDCSSYLPSPATPGVQAQTATPVNYCNPYKNICNPTDVLVDDIGSIVCDPRLPVYDCSQFFKTQGPPPEVVTCTPSLQTCNPTDVLLDESGNTLCDPSVNDCSKFLVSTPAPKAKPNVFHSLWIHYPSADEQGLAEAQAQEDEQNEIDRITCESVEKTGEIVGVAYTCIKAAGELVEVNPSDFGTLGKLAIHQSGKELAFCGSGVIFHEDPAGLLLGKVGLLTCKGTRGIVERIQGTNDIVARFMAADYDRIEKERKTWCTNYGATLDEFGHCWDLEIAYDNCAKAQKFWSTTDPEKYGVGKPIKLRDGFETTNQLGTFEYPCSFPPIPAPEDQVCTEVNSCPIDPNAGSGG